MATTNANDSRPRDNRGNARFSKINQDGKPFHRENKPYNKVKSSNDSFRQEIKPYNKDKDYDSDYKLGKSYSGGREQRMNDFRSKTSQSKEKEQQPDKLVTIKRLEREKKALQRKKQDFEERTERRNKPQIKHRRTNNIDWTRGYANGRYGDDDEDYTEYM